MKSNKKALELVEKGLSTKTIIKLTEAQIDVLHSRLYNEQVTQTNKPVYNVKGSGGNVSVPITVSSRSVSRIVHESALITTIPWKFSFSVTVTVVSFTEIKLSTIV
jgi:hypothetical protein